MQDIINEMPEPKTHYNTISSVVRKLQAEGYISHEAQGRSHLYVPVITKEEYRDFMWDHLHQTYFSGSDEEMIAYAKGKFGIQEEVSEGVPNVVQEETEDAEKKKSRKKKKKKGKDKKKKKKKKKDKS